MTSSPVSSAVGSATQEFTFGSIATQKSVPPSQPSEFDVDQFLTSESSSPQSNIELPPVEDADYASLENLRLVSAQFTQGCKTFQDIVDGTGLTASIVSACLNWLEKNNLMPMVAKNGDFYCSLNNIEILAAQLNACVQCSCKK